MRTKLFAAAGVALGCAAIYLHADGDGSSELLWAANANDTAKVVQLLKSGAQANERNALGATPLLEASFHANTDMVKALLDAGADPNVAGADGQTPLMLIARTSRVDAAKLLLAKRANPNAKESQKEQTALMWAAANSEAAMMRVLLEAGARPDDITKIDMMTPLVSAEPRAQPRSPGGMTAMLFVAREGCVECAKALLDHGASVDKPDPEGVTPLISALFNARFDTAKVLIEHGADVNRHDWWGRTPLYLAIDYNTLPHGGRSDQPSLDVTLPLEIAAMLLDRGANVNAQLKMFPPYRATGNDRGLDGMLTVGSTPLLRAAKAQDAPAIELLLKHGARMDLSTSQGMVPILAVAGIGSGERDSRGYYRATDIEEKAIASMNIMIAHGASVTAKAGRTDQTPLHGAAQWGWTKVIEYLVAKGADINAADSRGMTPLDYAQGRSGGRGPGPVRTEAAELIISKGGKAGTPVAQPGRGGPGGAPGGFGAPGAAKGKGKGKA